MYDCLVAFDFHFAINSYRSFSKFGEKELVGNIDYYFFFVIARIVTKYEKTFEISDEPFYFIPENDCINVNRLSKIENNPNGFQPNYINDA